MVALLVAAIAGLLVNYVLYLVSLSYVSPTVSTVITQLGPLLLMVGGVWVFHERLSKRQIIGIVLLIGGLLLFFNRNIGAFASLSGREGFGALILLIASATWAVYGLAQKALLKQFAPTQILLVIYIGATVLLAAFTHPLHAFTIDALEFTMLLLCAANTLVAYGALAEALKSAGAATVGAVLAVGPVATLIVTFIATKTSPGLVVPDDLNAATIVGAVVVTVGSALSARK
jgi:drug/metabolite transporter (DMT)-like permease